MQGTLMIKVTEEMLLQRAGSRSNARIAQYLPEVISLGEGLLEPRTVYGVFPIEKNEDERLCLQNGRVFHSEHLCMLLTGAEKLVAMCCTIGPALERKVSELNKDGRFFVSYLLDIYGAAAVGSLMRSLYQKIEGGYQGYGVTVYLEPGQLDWNIREQGVLFQLISPEGIGVSINESFMMKPVKTLTAVFGIGDVEKVKKGNLACEVCPKRVKCIFRYETEELLQDKS